MKYNIKKTIFFAEMNESTMNAMIYNFMIFMLAFLD